MYTDILANIIIQQYFVNARCLLIFTDKGNPFYYNGDIPIVKVNIRSEDINSGVIFHYFGCQEIVVKSSRPLWFFKTFENEIRLNMERFNSRKYLFISENYSEEKLMDIFDLQELQYVSDLIVMEENAGEIEEKHIYLVPQKQTVYNLWTHTYVDNTDNNKLLLDVWFSKNGTFKYSRYLFPNKLVNQMGRTLKMATFHYEPYSIIGPTADQYQGSELSTAFMFAKMYNMTPVLVINSQDYWGEIFDNWTGNGLLGNMALDKADIGFSALYTWEVDYHFLDLTKPLIRTGVTCLVPAPKLAAGWLTPLYSYSPAMWIAVGALFIVCVLSLFCLHGFYAKINSKGNMGLRKTTTVFGESIFGILKVFALQVVTKEEIPRGFIGSYFMGLLFLLSLFLASSYSGGLSTIMTVPRYENPINTPEEFVRSGLLWGGIQDAWITSIQEAKEPMYQELVRRFRTIPIGILREYSRTGKFAFALERLPHQNYAVGTYIKEDVIGNFRLMQEDFYWEQCVIMTRKSSILLPLLDMFILRTFEAGLISYWQNEAVTSYMDYNVQKALKYYYYHHNQHNVVKLQWIHVEGAFGILCIGCAISIIIFLLEIFVNRLKRNK